MYGSNSQVAIPAMLLCTKVVHVESSECAVLIYRMYYITA